MQPIVKLAGSKPPAPRLLWYPIMRGDQQAGELLAAFELFLVCFAFFSSCSFRESTRTGFWREKFHWQILVDRCVQLSEEIYEIRILQVPELTIWMLESWDEKS